MRLNRIKDSRGFTLIELMIVVVIIGILAALAIPRFMTASTKTKQSEAKLILKQIYVSQHAYRQQLGGTYFVTGETASKDNQEAFAEIWVSIASHARYSFTITSDNPSTRFTATAQSNSIDEDVLPDVWTIDQDGRMLNTCDDVTDTDNRS